MGCGSPQSLHDFGVTASHSYGPTSRTPRVGLLGTFLAVPIAEPHTAAARVRALRIRPVGILARATPACNRGRPPSHWLTQDRLATQMHEALGSHETRPHRQERTLNAANECVRVRERTGDIGPSLCATLAPAAHAARLPRRPTSSVLRVKQPWWHVTKTERQSFWLGGSYAIIALFSWAMMPVSDWNWLHVATNVLFTLMAAAYLASGFARRRSARDVDLPHH
jgi:hypothetical protein